MKNTDESLVKIIPSQRQLEFQQLEFYAFVHFSINVFTGKEWGDGSESPELFQPEKLDTDQWAKSICDAGMTGAILTCKHHDGFCIWPSRYTEHSIKNAPYKEGKGDIVAAFAKSCRKYSLKFGIYLSPWDRHSKLYGQGKPYDDYFVSQLEELLGGNYGDVFCVWLDGACGEGANGKVQHYDWERYYEVIRRLQPEACINVCGPDIRWCGNEAGDTRPSEWSVVPLRTQDTEKIKENSQKEDTAAFRHRKISAMDQDLGSREVLAEETELVWYQAEVNTSIRPGWFYHEEEDEQVKSLEELIRIYEAAVGGNSTFLLNIPPDKNGLFHPNDVKRLKELGDYLRRTYCNNRLEEGIASEYAYLAKEDYEQSLRMESGDKFTIKFREPIPINKMVLKEDIRKSQRIEAFVVYDGQERELYRGTVVGYKKIISLKECVIDTITIELTDSRMEVYLAYIGIFGKQ